MYLDAINALDWYSYAQVIPRWPISLLDGHVYCASGMNVSYIDVGYPPGLQAEEHGTPAQMREILYKLAHRLIVSSPTPSYISTERFHLHLSVLIKLELFDDAHKLLDSLVGRNICATSLSCTELRREVWRRKGLVKEEGELAKNLVLEKRFVAWGTEVISQPLYWLCMVSKRP